MKCPACSIDLTMSERNGVEIDYCSKCRGVWLDRGELDKIIERSSGFGGDGDDDDDDVRGRQPGQRRKKEGFFAQLFD